MINFKCDIGFISSAADIVSGAYAIPSRPASVVVVVRPSTFSKNRYSSYSFYWILMKRGTHILGVNTQVL